ncbi:hypothetical protein SAMN02745157_0704 [Kaistia soli DSM 19436]|uniref:DUF6950 domain-containing protein n=2 Tax=Kaistia TaxID=166953 RepID=A0A1M4VHL3_9HYPH|nr:hypothetical protein SAMN02745157_0704 [Kaistia soli DSM 19436]
MIADLDAFLASYGDRPWVWGEVDCSLVLADWAIANGHPDSAAQLRGSYATHQGCLAVVAAAGGVVPLVAACAAVLGLDALAVPERGAIGVVGAASNMHRQWGAIFDGRDWQVRLEPRFVALKAHPLGIWRI